MACGGCGQARGMVMSGLRSGNFRSVARGVAMGVAVNYEKVRGTYSEAKYNPGSSTPVIPAKPYQRPAEAARTK